MSGFWDWPVYPIGGVGRGVADSGSGPDVFATTGDIQSAIESLTTTEAYRLRKIARVLIPGTEYQEPGELLNEVFVRAMEAAAGRVGRRWPKNRLLFCAFVIETMKSLVDGSRESVWSTRTGSFAEAELHAKGPAVAVLSSPPVEEEVLEEEARDGARRAAARVAAQIESEFEDDEEVSLMLECLKDGITGAKAVEACGFRDLRHYETVRRRLRRGIDKLFPEGDPT
jgi:hypothetical protein